MDDRHADINIVCDKAMAAKALCKTRGDKHYGIFDKEVDEYYKREQVLISEAERGMDNGEFIAYLQPKFDVITGKVVGAEALARWLRPDGTLIMPGEFIRPMENHRMITHLDMCMLENVCAFLRNIIDAGIEPVTVSTNFSRLNIYTSDFVSELSAAADKYDIPHDLIEVELTETALELDKMTVIDIMAKIHNAGFRIALDDFGSGYSSFNMICDGSFDVIKIDKSMINDIASSEKASFLIESIINIARRLGMEVVAEGVETSEQMDVLHNAGCDTVQGFYTSPPVPEDDFIAFLK